MKRFISMLLVLTLAVGLFSACGKSAGKTSSESEEFQKVLAEKFGLTEGLSDKLKEAVILCLDQNVGFAGGSLQTMDTAATEVDGTLYIPGAFTIRGLGGEAEYDPETGRWTMELNGDELSIEPDFSKIIKNDKQEKTKDEILEAFQDFLISVDDFESLLHTKDTRDDALLYISNESIDEIEDLPEEGSKLLHDSITATILAANKTYPVNVNPTPEETFDRHEISKIVNIDPKHVPYQSQPETLVAVCGNMYVEDFSMKKHPTKLDYFVCSMNVYNYLGYTYGAVEAYTKDDALVDWDIIDAYDGENTSLLAPITDTMKLLEDGAAAIISGNFEYMGYKNQLDSVMTAIEIEVPKDGYIFITNNPNYSDRVGAMNAVLLFEIFLKSSTSMISAVNSLGMDSDPADMMSFLINALETQVIALMRNDPTAIEQLAGAFDEYMKTAPGMQLEFDEYTKNRWGSIGQIMDKSGATDLLIGVLEGCTMAAEEVFNVAVSTLISAFPGGGMALGVKSLIDDGVKLYCILMDIEHSAQSQPIIFEACDWRSAYASFLRSSEFMDSRWRFFLCYITDDSIPELVLIDGTATTAQAKLYTYEDNTVLYHPEKFYATYGSFIYGEYLDMKETTTFRAGHTNTGYTTMFYSSRLPECSFSDNEDEDGADIQYLYNGKKVGAKYYYKKKTEMEEQFEKRQKVAYYDNGYKITEANIKKYIEKD